MQKWDRGDRWVLFQRMMSMLVTNKSLKVLESWRLLRQKVRRSRWWQPDSMSLKVTDCVSFSHSCKSAHTCYFLCISTSQNTSLLRRHCNFALPLASHASLPEKRWRRTLRKSTQWSTRDIPDQLRCSKYLKELWQVNVWSLLSCHSENCVEYLRLVNHRGCTFS